MEIFRYGQLEIDHLTRRDKKLGAVITQIGMIERKITPDPFAALVRSVVAQQISGRAAASIWGRLCERLPEMTPAGIADAEVDNLRACGLSMRKAEYVRGIGTAAISGEVDFARLHELPDEEIIQQLSSLHGIGVWTAEMLLIFSLCRPDVVSWGDLAIRRGMMKLYGLSTLTKEQFARYRKRYSPYGSVASLYLWQISTM